MTSKSPAEQPLVLTIEETAKLLNSHHQTVRKGIKAGTIPHLRIGRKIVIPRAKLMAVLGLERAY